MLLTAMAYQAAGGCPDKRGFMQARFTKSILSLHDSALSRPLGLIETDSFLLLHRRLLVTSNRRQKYKNVTKCAVY